MLNAEAGRDDGRRGLSATWKLDFRLALAGDGGIWANVSIVRSDNEGRGLLFTGLSTADPSSLFSTALPLELELMVEFVSLEVGRLAGFLNILSSIIVGRTREPCPLLTLLLKGCLSLGRAPSEDFGAGCLRELCDCGCRTVLPGGAGIPEAGALDERGTGNLDNLGMLDVCWFDLPLSGLM